MTTYVWIPSLTHPAVLPIDRPQPTAMAAVATVVSRRTPPDATIEC